MILIIVVCDAKGKSYVDTQKYGILFSLLCVY